MRFSIQLLSVVFTSFVFVLILNADTVKGFEIARNNGSVYVNDIMVEKGFGDPNVTSSSYFMSSDDVTSKAGTNSICYVVQMGVFTDYLIPRYDFFFPDVLADPGLVLSGKRYAGPKEDTDYTPYMYSPYNPVNDSRFDIAEVVEFVEGAQYQLGSSAKKVSRDNRDKLSAWGERVETHKGGCCRSTNDAAETDKWGKPYRILVDKINTSYMYFHPLNVSLADPRNSAKYVLRANVSDIFMRYDNKYTGVLCSWVVSPVEKEDKPAPLAASSVPIFNITGNACFQVIPFTAVYNKPVNYSVTVTLSTKAGDKVFWRSRTATEVKYFSINGTSISTTTASPTTIVSKTNTSSLPSSSSTTTTTTTTTTNTPNLTTTTMGVSTTPSKVVTTTASKVTSTIITPSPSPSIFTQVPYFTSTIALILLLFFFVFIVI